MTRTILIVDDEADLASTCARVLRRSGWQVDTAGTREAALAMMGEARRALAIVDRKLPDGDGFDVLRAARTTGTPVIVITGYTSAETRRQAIDEGAAAFLSKPFSTQALVELVESVAGKPPGPGH
jgi:DNA-binding response OmpR family regulator